MIFKSTKQGICNSQIQFQKKVKNTILFSVLFFSLFITNNVYAQAPPSPVGFVANPRSSLGEVFLAVGPNQVADPEIEYRLFFSPTASAPADPTTATEYMFGSTPGDGGGDNPFGFNLSGLMPGIDYTFYLYQFNTTTMEFSDTPATAMQTAGADSAPDPPAGFVCNANDNPGEAFLAVGPNDTSDPDISYRLFFSLTATAPADPTMATEYTFGSTPGDGGGNNAFGFTMGGLVPGADYTFYLYQFNMASMEFSPSPGTCETTPLAALPVTWYSPLKATLENSKSIKLDWSVTEQINNDRFIIEHSSDGIVFSSIGEIKGDGTLSALQAYSYLHENPVNGNNYYRIHQEDFDGNFEKSNMATVWYGSKNNVYPNPASAEVTIYSASNTTLTMKDFHGRPLKTILLSEGENALLLNDIPTGMYILNFENGDVELFVKQ